MKYDMDGSGKKVSVEFVYDWKEKTMFDIHVIPYFEENSRYSNNACKEAMKYGKSCIDKIINYNGIMYKVINYAVLTGFGYISGISLITIKE
uniref:Uncharacterized protein n=1 Tax=viral metagenome TaxID=1070528 RepID=A0A6M3IMB5_9ZZZZ